MSELRDKVFEVLAETGIVVLEEAERPGHPASLAPLPARLHRTVADSIRSQFGDTIYSHQAAAIDAILSGSNVALSTPTASGKSLVFMAAAASILKANVKTRVICLYPAVALLHDQYSKWQAFLDPLNLSVEFIAGEVLTRDREQRVARADVLLMTPDVLHAWGMSHLDSETVATLLQDTRLVVLDEAHVYDGVFGTNMAYFLRRLLAVIPAAQLVVSTATIADVSGFIERLTGCVVTDIGPSEDGSPTSERSIVLAKSGERGGFEAMVTLVQTLADRSVGKFLAFGDSRPLVERVVAAARRDRPSDTAAETDEDSLDTDFSVPGPHRVLPYRAGYEDEDRQAIEEALRSGHLAGVVSTSALELGLDIGDIDIVLLLSPAPSMKSFWQRAGRGGRRRGSVTIILDERDVIRESFGGLSEYLLRPIEPNWLYLENPYLQYGQALCAAQEISLAPWFDRSVLNTLPTTFRDHIANEIEPREAVPVDLYPLKQRASEQRPQYAFPLRSDLEREFTVLDRDGRRFGRLSHSQSLREAYPGAIYYYLAKPFRVREFSQLKGEIRVEPERNYSTQRRAQVMVFPKFAEGVRAAWTAGEGFVVEAALQVNERVIGFTERRGSLAEVHTYGPGSHYEQRPLSRVFDTTGVCWMAPVVGSNSTRVQELILEAYCLEFGVQSRDLGQGGFFSNTGLNTSGPCKGDAVYDSTKGSLRLSSALAENFQLVVRSAERLSVARGESDVITSTLRSLAHWSAGLQPFQPNSPVPLPPTQASVFRVISRGQVATFHVGDYAREVLVKDFRFTPTGIRYEVESDDPGVTRFVPLEALSACDEQTRWVVYDAMTGDESDG